MPSNEVNEPPYFRRRKDTDGKKAEHRNQMSWKSAPSCIISIYTCIAIVADLQFAKLLDLVSNAEIVEFGETRGMRYRNWGVGCTEE